MPLMCGFSKSMKIEYWQHALFLLATFNKLLQKDGLRKEFPSLQVGLKEYTEPRNSTTSRLRNGTNSYFKPVKNKIENLFLTSKDWLRQPRSKDYITHHYTLC